MAKVEHWFPDFVILLTDRIRRGDWPSGDAEFWETLQSRFIHHGVRCDEASAASAALMDAPPEYLDRVWPALLDAVKAVRRDAASAGAAPDDREEARRLSAGCPYCSGAGTLSVVHPDPDPAKRRPPSLAAACVCPHGRFLKAALARGLKPGQRAGFLDLEAVLDGRSEYQLPGADTDAIMAFWGEADESVREAWRRRVRARIPSLARWEVFVEVVSARWCFAPDREPAPPDFAPTAREPPETARPASRADGPGRSVVREPPPF